MRFTQHGAALLLVIALVALLAALLIPPKVYADQQGMPTTYTTPTNMPAIVNAGTVSNNILSFIPIRQGRGMSIMWQFNLSTTNYSSNVGLYLAPTVDGTNADSVVWPWIVAPSTTNLMTRTTNWARGTLDGYVGFFVLAQTNGNTGVLTNRGLLFNTPNN